VKSDEVTPGSAWIDTKTLLRRMGHRSEGKHSVSAAISAARKYTMANCHKDRGSGLWLSFLDWCYQRWAITRSTVAMEELCPLALQDWGAMAERRRRGVAWGGTHMRHKNGWKSKADVWPSQRRMASDNITTIRSGDITHMGWPFPVDAYRRRRATCLRRGP